MPADRTFPPVSVEGIGEFTFRKRTWYDQMALEGAAERITGGPVQSEGLQYFATAAATLKVLMVSAPPGFDLNDLDPLDPASYLQVQSVFKEFRAAEARFRAAA